MKWSYPNHSFQLYAAIAITLAVGFGIMYGLTLVPVRWRRPIVATCTFLAGLIYVAYYFWPKPMPDAPKPYGFGNATATWFKDAISAVGDLGNTLTTFLLGLGIYSIVRIHGKKLIRRQTDWGFSLVMLVSLVLMIIFGYWNYYLTNFSDGASKLQVHANWTPVNYVTDFLFDGLLQQMDGAMFSIIAFYILSAAYRAFRVRSVEATILLSSALIVMLSLLGAVEYGWDLGINHLAPGSFVAQNFYLTEISKWITATFQTPGLRALDFGIGLGALAMGLRLWLSLEKGGISA